MTTESLDESKDPVAISTSDASEIIDLNVGATLYTTTRGTLQAVPDSMLSLMLDSKWKQLTQLDKQG